MQIPETIVMLWWVVLKEKEASAFLLNGNGAKMDWTGRIVTNLEVDQVMFDEYDDGNVNPWMDWVQIQTNVDTQMD
jgi:hypothetical protein